VCCAGGLALFAPALDGEFLSDDLHYIASNPYIQQPSAENLIAILDPRDEPALLIANYAPLHLLAHTFQWQLWRDSTRGYHVTNIVLHALAVTLLVAFFAFHGLSRWEALLAGLLFFVHPANAEVVAWSSQLKTLAGLILLTGALLAHPRWPLLGIAFFALALLTKPQTLLALPVVAVCSVCAPPDDPRWRQRRKWIGLWVAIALLWLPLQFAAFEHTGQVENPYPDLGVHLRSVAAYGARYLVMAASGQGLSTFHQPEAAQAWLDPWWLVSLGVGSLLAWRWLWALAARRPEAIFWTWAAAGWMPISQLFPFLFPVADRYLYFILPGLLGGGFLAASDLAGRIADRGSGTGTMKLRALSRASGLGVAVVALAFAAQARGRAAVWSSATSVEADAAAHYPEGIYAHLLRMRHLGRAGDASGTAHEIRALASQGWLRFMELQRDPALARVRDAPAVQAALCEVATEWIEGSRKYRPTRGFLRARAAAHQVRGEFPEAVAALESALAIEGPMTPQLRRELDLARQVASRPDRPGEALQRPVSCARGRDRAPSGRVQD
jgi:hypothetical protein